jgi:hypothetical protein
VTNDKRISFQENENEDGIGYRRNW